MKDFGTESQTSILIVYFPLTVVRKSPSNIQALNGTELKRLKVKFNG